MTQLQTTVPTSVDSPGTFHTFKNVKVGGSLIPLVTRVALVGVMAAAGTATAVTPVQLLDVADAITKCGQGSELALMAAKAFEQGLLNKATGRGGMPELWACPIAAVAGGGAVAAAYTFTVVVTTALAGTIVLRIAGRTINVGVTAGDAQNTIAAAINAEINSAARDLPVTSAVLANVATTTATHTGTNGNDIVHEVVSQPSGVTVTAAASVVGVGTVDITAALDALVDKNYSAIAISIHSAGAISDALTHLIAMWAYDQKFWRWVFMGDAASLGTAQGYATSADTEKIVIPSCERCPNLPSEMAAAAAVFAFGVEAPNANYDDAELALYPPPTSYAYTGAEKESAIDGGVTPLLPSFDGSRLRCGRLVTTKITDNGVAYKLLADLAYSRTPAYRAEQYDANYRLRFRQEVLDGGLTDPDATLLKRIRDMCVEVDRTMGGLGYLRDVETLVPQIRVEEAVAPAGRVLVQAPLRTAGPLHQVAFEHLNYLS